MIEWPAALTAIVGAAKVLGSAGDAIVTRLWPRFTARRAVRNLAFTHGAEEFTADHFLAATRYYIEPSCGPLDPAGAEEYRLAFNVPVPLFKALDEALYERAGRRFLLLLADSGMGKTSALLNYYVRNLRRRDRAPIALFYLGHDRVEERIAVIPNKAATILFLDALDEDPKAIADHRARVSDLMRQAAGFRSVIISCRSQFFLREEEITRDTGIANIGPRAAGEGATHSFFKLYLSPLSDSQVEAYLRRRYPLSKRKRRRSARELVSRIGDLSARPMLLAYIDDLTSEPEVPLTTWDAYTRIIAAWLERERAFVGDTDALRAFSQRLAVDLYVRRSGERIDSAELGRLAIAWGIQLDPRKLTGRSLLNRNAVGQYKFAHRSILEYLFVEAALRGTSGVFERDWTDLMEAFLIEAEASPGAIEWLAQSVGHALAARQEVRAHSLVRALVSRATIRLMDANLTHPAVSADAAEQCAEYLYLMHWSITGDPASVHLYTSLREPVSEAYALRTRYTMADGVMNVSTEPMPMKSEAASRVHAELNKALSNAPHSQLVLLAPRDATTVIGCKFDSCHEPLARAGAPRVHDALQAMTYNIGRSSRKRLRLADGRE
jgi:hypothetical protein